MRAVRADTDVCAMQIGDCRDTVGIFQVSTCTACRHVAINSNLSRE
ncbi:unnamed protein product [Callosobruchus maculatus]|uniref:Uncharacterized protein n=1 Tax=Callosobruchus maculatus TaxID=64391 RepID=A0A653DHP6_CALMS|nr:unnamed protein product [Callosobruchus maculatus]